METNTLNNLHLKECDNIIMLSDIHFGVRNNSIEWLENICDYFYNFFIPFLKKNANDKTTIVITGDVFDSRQSIDIRVLSTSLDIIKDILKSNSNIEIIIVEGNHDSYKKRENDITSLSIFKSIDRVYVIQEPTIEILNDNTKLLFLPWFGDMKQQNEVINEVDADFVFMHNDITSAYYDNGRPIINGVNISTIKNKKVYSGHIHRRYDGKKYTYVGTPYQLRRSDIGNEKGIYMLIKGKNKWQEKFFLNNYSPKFLKVNIEDILEKTLPELESIFKNNYVDIIVNKKYCKYLNQQKVLDLLSIFKYSE
jgi:DNA repair exonuclease SbcCD nuclease subunit